MGRKLAILMVAAVVAAACKGGDTAPLYYCNDAPPPSLLVAVVDSVTGAPAATAGLWARAREGSFVDSTGTPLTGQENGAIVFALGSNRVGSYTVTVHAPGYADWVKAGVVVPQGNQCYVATVTVLAKLAH